MSGPSALEAVLLKAREVAGDPHRFEVYADNPVGFAEEILGVLTLWEKQKEILQAAVTYDRVSIRAGHSVGKSFVMAILVLWWLYARKGLVVTTANTWDQVEQVLWREINKLAEHAKVPLPGTALDTERKIDRTWYAVGLATNKPSAFQGRHHARLLVVVDEAAGVAEQVHLEISTLATGEENCIVMVGNPTETSGTFYESHTKDRASWHCIAISCYDHPNVKAGKELIKGAVTQRWIDGRVRKWGIKHPLFYSRVLGQFPMQSERGTIPLVWAERGQDQTLYDEKGNPDPQGKTRLERVLDDAKEQQHLRPMIALDVARYGLCKCVMGLRYGDGVESIEAWEHASTMETAGRAYKLWRETDASMVVVDDVGVGGGVVDRLAELGVPVFGFNSQHRAFTPSHYNNRRSELWWLVRRRLENDRLHYPLTDDDQLISDLVAPTYRINSTGRTEVETKEKLLERGVPSPDFADMLVMLFADSSPEAFEEELHAEPEQDTEAFEEEFVDAPDRSEFDTLPAGF